MALNILALPSVGVYLLVGVVASILLQKYLRALGASNGSQALPPGPPGRFLVGNLFDIPTENVHAGLARLAGKYGPIIYFTLPTSKMIVLSTAKVASELLEKRSTIFADRPRFPMVELMGWGWDITFERYGESWRTHRKIARRHLNSLAVKQFASLQTRLARVFVSELFEAPTEFLNLIRRNAAAGILEATYGFEILRDNDIFVKIAEDAMETVREVMVPGKYAVDLIPLLEYIPKWFPGAQFKRDAENWRVHPERTLKVAFARTKAEMASGTARPSIVSAALAEDTSPEWEQAVIEAAAPMYLGGADTTIYTLMIFFLEMARHPEMQSRAQEELFRVIGNDRLPTLDDRESLPYIEAIIRETLRMYPVVPLGVPHRATEDTWYEGMLIPKGAAVYANIWAILHDPELYANPLTFDPDRFLLHGKINNTIPHPRSAVFGYGRRMCPGMHFADMNIFLMVVTTLACVDLRKHIENGIPDELPVEFEHGFVSIPLPFRCSIKPRSHSVKILVAHALEAEK